MPPDHPAASVLAAVRERDIDLLLVEELRASNALRRLFCDAVLHPDGIDRPGASTPPRGIPLVAHVRHSVARDDTAAADSPRAGETDIDVVMSWRDADDQTGQGRERCIGVLIENKIGARLMPDQPERYRAFGSRRREALGAEAVYTLLVAPAGYIESAPGAAVFDACLSYETIESHFRARAKVAEDRADGEQCDRMHHRAEVVAQAMTNWRRGFVSVPHEAVSAFWRGYHALATVHAPSLRMRPPKSVGQAKRNIWVDFRDALPEVPELTRRTWPTGGRHDITHKLREGRVDLHLGGWRARESDALPLLDPLLGDGMTVRRANKSLAISLTVPELDPEQPIDVQQQGVIRGLEAALTLQVWFGTHAATLVLPTLAPVKPLPSASD